VDDRLSRFATEVTNAVDPFVWDLGPDGVARIRWTAGTVVTEDLARVTTAQLASRTGGKLVPILADIRQVKSMTREARKYYGNLTNAVTAIALLVGSPTTQVMANFFLGLNRPNVPTQMFTDEDKALTWLRRYTV
jgi:hypothetical protein